MTLDPLLSLALNVHASKGVYALLLGSGVSRSAKISTGWEVVLDLITRIAKLSGEDCGSDPAAWFKQKHGEEPDYAKLLDMLASSSDQRQQILRRYFEPTEEERAQDLKQPTPAHKAVARLVASGYIRIVISTNFDRLTETAIQEAGITPVVLSTRDSLAGAVPLVHQQCVVVKLHGDYLDTRIRNTPSELEKYEAEVDALLDRVFDEFGLIVVGWSGEYDTALRRAIERCKSRRFGFWWASMGEPKEIAQRLVTVRGGSVLKIIDADRFLPELAEKVSVLDDVYAEHPLNTAAAVALVKRYLSNEGYRVKLHDFVLSEVDQAARKLTEYDRGLHSATVQRDWPRILQHNRALLEIPVALMLHGCRFSTDFADDYWPVCVRCITRTSSPGSFLPNGYPFYGSATLIYAGGISAIIAGRYELLRKLFETPIITNFGRGPAVLMVRWSDIDTITGPPWLPVRGMAFLKPLSDHLFKELREPFRSYLPDDISYEFEFDRFEYFLALAFVEYNRRLKSTSHHPPIGRFRRLDRHLEEWIGTRVVKEMQQYGGSDWPPIQARLFESLGHFREAESELENCIMRLAMP